MYKSSFELQRFILPSKKWQPNLACAKKAFYLKLTPGTISLYKEKFKRRRNKNKMGIHVDRQHKIITWLMTIFDKTQKISSKWAFKTDNLSEYHFGKQKTGNLPQKVKGKNSKLTPCSIFKNSKNILTLCEVTPHCMHFLCLKHLPIFISKYLDNVAYLP